MLDVLFGWFYFISFFSGRGTFCISLTSSIITAGFCSAARGTDIMLDEEWRRKKMTNWKSSSQFLLIGHGCQNEAFEMYKTKATTTKSSLLFEKRCSYHDFGSILLQFHAEQKITKIDSIRHSWVEIGSIKSFFFWQN